MGIVLIPFVTLIPFSNYSRMTNFYCSKALPDIESYSSWKSCCCFLFVICSQFLSRAAYETFAVKNRSVSLTVWPLKGIAGQTWCYLSIRVLCNVCNGQSYGITSINTTFTLFTKIDFIIEMSPCGENSLSRNYNPDFQ